MFQGHISGQNKVSRWENKGKIPISLSLGSLRPAQEPVRDLGSFQELPHPCSLQSLGQPSSDLLDEKQGYNLFFQSVFKAIYLGRLRGKNWPILYLPNRCSPTVIKAGYWKRMILPRIKPLQCPLAWKKVFLLYSREFRSISCISSTAWQSFFSGGKTRWHSFTWMLYSSSKSSMWPKGTTQSLEENKVLPPINYLLLFSHSFASFLQMNFPPVWGKGNNILYERWHLQRQVYFGVWKRPSSLMQVETEGQKVNLRGRLPITRVPFLMMTKPWETLGSGQRGWIRLYIQIGLGLSSALKWSEISRDQERHSKGKTLME